MESGAQSVNTDCGARWPRWTEYRFWQAPGRLEASNRSTWQEKFTVYVPPQAPPGGHADIRPAKDAGAPGGAALAQASEGTRVTRARPVSMFYTEDTCRSRRCEHGRPWGPA